MSAMNRPMIRSLRPSPYTSAVSRNVTPDSTAACSTASASRSLTLPQSAPSCQVPRPITETGRLVRPKTRCSTISDPTGRAGPASAGGSHPEPVEDGPATDQATTPGGTPVKAARYEKTGPARDVLTVTDTERPEPGPGEVRVRVHASGVNPTDVKARSGAVPRPI